MSELAATHTGRGLPRGRGSLPPDEVAAAQRERILRAMIGAVAERGYADARIADVVERARVSKQSFYALFADKGECFLAAHAQGLETILGRLGEWASAAPELGAQEQLRGGIGAYLGLAVAEPEFAYCMLVELPAIGAEGLRARIAAHAQIAALLRVWHALARTVNPTWPAVPDSRYDAAVGAVHDLLFVAVSAPDGDATAIAPAAFDAVLTLLQIPDKEN